MTELSPVAQAVDDAFWTTVYGKFDIYSQRRTRLAAALRAVAEQGATFYWDGCPVQAVTVGSLLAIADELEAL